MASDSPAAILFDAYGNEIALADGYQITVDTKGVPIIIINDSNEATLARSDSDGYLLSSTRVTEPLPAGTNVIGEVGVDSTNTGGLALETTQQTLATEATLTDAYNKLNSLEAKDFATETTQQTLATENTLTDAYNAVTNIKNIDGIKKITDALPTGDNEIGRIKLIDEYGSFIGSSDQLDGYNRLQVDAVLSGLNRIVNVDEDDNAITVRQYGGFHYIFVRDVKQLHILQEIRDELKQIRIFMDQIID